MAFDYVVIGSGYGGLLPAWRLTRAGARVLLIERGLRRALQDFKQSWDPLYLKDFYDFGYTANLTSTYRASRVLGGGSVMNSMMHQRVPSEAFDWVDPDRRKRAWPQGLGRAVLEPYYEQAETLLGIRQLSWNEVPRIGGNFARMMHDAGLSCDPARMNLGPGCVRCGFCEAGCGFREGKITLVDRTLDEALATGNLTLEQDLTAARIREKGGAYQVECVRTGRALVGQAADKVFEAPGVILAAGPLGTVPLLFRSRDGLRRMSKLLGAYANNNGDVNFILQIPERYPDHYGYKSTNNAGVITYGHWKEHRVTMHPGFSPIAVMAGIDARFQGKLAWGLEHKHFVKKNAIHRLIPVNAMRQIDSDLVLGIDEHGLARVLVVSEKERGRHGQYMAALAKKTAEACGGRVMLTGIGSSPLDQGGNHILGGARMSDEPGAGVVNPHGELFGHKGIYVTDSAAIPSTLGINPALTIGANALRIADKIATGRNA